MSSCSVGFNEAVNYSQFNIGTPERQVRDMYWNFHEMSPFKAGGSEWTIGQGESKEVGTVHRWYSMVGLESTPGSGATNGAADILRPIIKTDTFERCAEWRGTIKVDDSEYTRIMELGYNPKSILGEGVTRYLDQQITPFQIRKLLASANPCNIVGSESNPLLVYSEFTLGLTTAIPDAVLPSTVWMRLKAKVDNSYGLGAANQFRMFGNSDFKSALAHEKSILNTKVACSNGDQFGMCELAGHGVKFEATNWLCPVGVKNNKPVYAVVLYDTRRIATPADILKNTWEADGFQSNLYIRATYGFGVQDTKAVAVAYIQFV
jgi:hypothetical protein